MAECNIGCMYSRSRFCFCTGCIGANHGKYATKRATIVEFIVWDKLGGKIWLNDAEEKTGTTRPTTESE